MNDYVQIGEEAVAYIFDDELTHHGTKGMKWGIRRYQNKDGSLTPEGRQRYSNDADKYERKASKTTDAKRKAKYEQRAKDARDKVAKYDADKAIKDEEEKQRVLREGTAEEVMRYRGRLTVQELQNANARLNQEQQLRSYLDRDVERQKKETLVDKLLKNADGKMKKVDNLHDIVRRGLFAYDTIAKINNTFNKNFELPDIDGGKSRKDKIKKAEQEKLDKKRADRDRFLRTVDDEYVAQHLDEFSNEELSALAKRRKNINTIAAGAAAAQNIVNDDEDDD